jgi:hypothetical protein
MATRSLKGLALVLVVVVAGCQETVSPSRTIRFTGRAVDALTGDPVSGVEVSVAGDVVGVTGTDGSFTAAAAASASEATFARPGFLPTTAPLPASTAGAEVVSLGTIPLSEPLEPGQLRIVLTWRDAPADLDAHITGTSTQGERFHVFWRRQGSLGEGPRIQHQHDAYAGHGPETITLSRADMANFRVLVHDFSNSHLQSTQALGQSGATLRVYGPNGQLGSFDVPRQAGSLWRVLSFDGATGTFLPLNEMAYLHSPGLVE